MLNGNAEGRTILGEIDHGGITMRSKGRIVAEFFVSTAEFSVMNARVSWWKDMGYGQ